MKYITLKHRSRRGSHDLPVNTPFTSFGASIDVNALPHVDRAAKLSERVAVSMENGRHFGFLSGCAAQDVRATLRRMGRWSLTGCNVSTDATMVESDEKARSSKLSGFPEWPTYVGNLHSCARLKSSARHLSSCPLMDVVSPGHQDVFFALKSPTKSALYLTVKLIFQTVPRKPFRVLPTEAYSSMQWSMMIFADPKV